jgi:hypothetical protein
VTTALGALLQRAIDVTALAGEVHVATSARALESMIAILAFKCLAREHVWLQPHSGQLPYH